jgi:formiminotetrahydrofolate cyclodeaminase
MPDSLWTGTLAAFRDRLAGLEPVPAGVSAAAVTASFGLALFNKVLEIASNRKDFAGDRELAEHLLHEGRNQSQLLAHLADRDIAAYRQYLDARKRNEPVEAALRKTVETPLNVARTAIAGLRLCEQATGLIHAAVAPDLVTAQSLLAAGTRSALGTVTANLEQLASADPFRQEVAAETRELLQKLQTA